MSIENRSRFETLEAGGGKIMETLENLINEGNSRKISIKQADNIVAEFPLTFGVVGAVLAPAVAGLGAIAALATGCTIELERRENGNQPQTPSHTGPRPVEDLS
jgi:hypothetical protein